MNTAPVVTGGGRGGRSRVQRLVKGEAGGQGACNRQCCRRSAGRAFAQGMGCWSSSCVWEVVHLTPAPLLHLNRAIQASSAS